VVYLRGLNELRTGAPAEAIAEFQKILSKPMFDPVPFSRLAAGRYVEPLARLGLARAHALHGDTPKARTAYQDFFAAWKEADPDIPILKQAKAEYAKLK
jgi:eukaryotic-like serine/threonine-protein kinase